MQDPWHDPMAASPNNTLNLLEQDDTHPMLQLIKADNVMGSGGSLQLQAMNEEPIPEDKRLKIAQHGVEVATGHYGFRLTTAPGDGLYVNYGLNKLDIHANKELVLAEREGDRQSAADMSAQIIGEGHLVIDTAGQVSLSNGNNNYSGDTRINKGVLRTDANDALGKTANLSISNLTQLNLNATAQTVRTFSGQSGSLLDFNGGYLTLSEGGISNGMLTGEGNFHVTISAISQPLTHCLIIDYMTDWESRSIPTFSAMKMISPVVCGCVRSVGTNARLLVMINLKRKATVMLYNWAGTWRSGTATARIAGI